MDWIDRFSGLSGLNEDLRARLLEKSKIVQVDQGALVFGPGKVPEYLLLLLDGTVRVQQVTSEGREIVLYRVNAGDSCVLTTACLLAYEDYSAEGITETEVTAAAIPRAVFEELISSSPDFRRFVFTAYSKRIADLFYIIEEIAFRRMDIRLAQRLLELDRGNHKVKSTHAQLAAELGTAREVISRQLQEFQRREWVKLSRGSVGLTDLDALKKLAATQ